jgi:hypothetical protein
MDAVLKYPCYEAQLRAIIAERAGIPQANILVVPKNHPEEQRRWNEDGASDIHEYKQGEAVLDKEYEDNAEAKAASDSYAKAESILKELSTPKVETESKEKGKQFWANIEAKKAAEESLNIYKRQVSGLRRAYRQARSEGNELAAFQINELLDEYQRGVPKEEGAKRRAAIEGTIERRNIEFNERRKRAEEEKRKRASLYSANPDAPQFDSTSSAFEPISLTYQ